jgi:uncharacterized protein (UPF0212 family)
MFVEKCPQCGKVHRSLFRTLAAMVLVVLALTAAVAAVYVSGHHFEIAPVEKGE